MKKTIKRCKYLSLLLSMIILFSNSIMPVIAVDAEEMQPTVDSAQNTTPISEELLIDPIIEPTLLESISLEKLKEMPIGEKPLLELQEMTVDLASIPEVIAPQAALQKGHVNRLEEQESDLNTLIYQNTDGTKSTYIFNAPVKYIDSNGIVRDKSSKISQLLDTAYSYGMTNNSAKVYFPRDISVGTMLNYDQYSISMVPVTDATSSPTYDSSNETITYANVFGANTALLYKTRLDGVKEDIVLFKNIGKSQFEFTLSLVGLTPQNIDDEWYLVNSDGTRISSLGKIIIEDSAGNITEGNMSITSTNERGKYSVIVTAPAEFLNDSKTQYPVYIDPTIYITETAHYEWVDDEGNEYGEQYQAIVDLNVFLEEDAAATADLSLYSELGYFENDDARVIMKFYDFYGENGSCTSLDAGDIGKATLYFYVHSGVATTITAHPMTCTWDNDVYGENPTTLADVELWEGANPTVSSSISVGSAACEVAMDITAITKLWANSQSDPSYGLILDSSSSGYRMISSTENSDPYDIYLVLDTNQTNGLYYINNAQNNNFLGTTTGELVDYMVVCSGTRSGVESLLWNLIYIGEDKYYIRSALSPYYYLYEENQGLAMSELPVNSKDAYTWKLELCSSGILIKNISSNRVLHYDKTAEVPENYIGAPWTLVTQLPSSNSNFANTVWRIFPHGIDGVLISRIDEDNSNRSAFIGNVMSSLTNSSAHCTALSSSEITISEMQNLLSNYKFFAIHTHGDKDEFKIGSNTYFNIDNIENTNMSNVNLAVFLTCSGGEGGYNPNNVANSTPQNIVEACIVSGATTCIAFSETTYVDACNIWLSNLISEMRASSSTLSEAIDALQDDDITYNPDHDMSTRFDLSDIDVIGGNANIYFSDIFN